MITAADALRKARPTHDQAIINAREDVAAAVDKAAQGGLVVIVFRCPKDVSNDLIGYLVEHGYTVGVDNSDYAAAGRTAGYEFLEIKWGEVQ